MIVFDILLLVVLLIGCLLGYKRGFFGSITKPLKIIASICLTIVISSPIINAWTRPLFTGKVEGWIYNSLSEAFADSSADIAAEKMPTLLKLFAENGRIIFKKRGFILEIPYKIIEKQRKMP